MQKQKENLFINKFRLLNSQENTEHTEEINWSSSGSSDTSLITKLSNRTNKSRTLKRKRKKKRQNNISNLSFTILNTSRKISKEYHEEKSPILCSRGRQKSASLSPILRPLQVFLRHNTTISPILPSQTARQKSPILVPKTESPISASKVRKKLFVKEKVSENYLDRTCVKKEELSNQSVVKTEAEDTPYNNKRQIITECNENELQNLVLDSAKPNVTKPFFDSYFSSESTSLNSQAISEVLTPQNSTKTSDEIDILTCKTQNVSNTLKQENMHSSGSSCGLTKNTNKKVRYKKFGLAYRLDNLLKKQTASSSLWQHEKFLAANSNFVIPKGECNVFRIQKTQIKYGCHLFEAVDCVENVFLILINSTHVSDNVTTDMVLKIYEPYKVLPFEVNCNLIINVIKFEFCEYLIKQNN